MKVGLLSLMLAAAGIVIPVAAQAVAQVYQLDIPRQQLDAALKDLAQQTGLQIARFSDTPGGSAFVGPVTGDMLVTDALETLLAPSKLTYKIVNDHTIAVMTRVAAAAAQGEPPPATGSSQSADAAAGEPNQQEGKKSFRDNFRLAQGNLQAAQRSSTVGSDAQSSAANSGNSPRLEEIIVTAQKREERQQDVPVAMTVLDPQVLAENGQNRLIDYFASVPGLNVAANANGGGTQYITIRGLSAGAKQNPIVTTVVDDVPTTSSLARSFGGGTAPDLDPSDLAQIEVLKGPQGTLYGADSLGGLIKYVTTDPSTKALSGRVQVDGVDIPGGGSGYAVRGAINVPLSDIFALRASAFSRHDPGYIDDLTTGQKNFNSSDVYGARIGALLRPSDDLSVKLSALYQKANGDQSIFNSNISGQSAFGDLGLTTLPGTTRYTTQDQLYTASVNWRVAGLQIVSVTGYVVNTLKNAADDTALLGSFAYSCQYEQSPNSCQLPPGTPAGIDGVPTTYDVTTRKISQEIRVGSSLGSWLDWRLGGFYTHEEGSPWQSDVYGASPTTGAIYFVNFAQFDPIQAFHEYAAFGDATVHVTDRFDVELGGRESWNEQEDQIVTTGAATKLFTGGLSPFVGPLLEDSASAFTYQATPRFKISPDLMFYGRIATGYRIGGYNQVAGLPAVADVPASYQPDKTTDYELGMKGTLFDGNVSFDTSIYYINWKDFQIDVLKYYPLSTGQTTYTGYTANAGNAKSEGLEFSVEAHPVQGSTITAQGSYDDAVLTEDIPASNTAYGLKGDRLPYSMKFSGGLAVKQDIRLTKEWMGFVGGAVNYVGSRPYEFTAIATQPREVFPAYTQFNLRTGAHYESWLINLYLNNVADKRGVVGIQPSYSAGNFGVNNAGYNATVIQPRTIGLSVAKTF